MTGATAWTCFLKMERRKLDFLHAWLDGFLLLFQDPSCALDGIVVEMPRHVPDSYVLSRTWRIDHLVPADIDADVGDSGLSEVDKVSRLCLGDRDIGSDLGLVPGYPGKVHAEFPIDVGGETGAVESAWCASTPDIWDADEGLPVFYRCRSC